MKVKFLIYLFSQAFFLLLPYNNSTCVYKDFVIRFWDLNLPLLLFYYSACSVFLNMIKKKRKIKKRRAVLYCWPTVVPLLSLGLCSVQLHFLWSSLNRMWHRDICYIDVCSFRPLLAKPYSIQSFSGCPLIRKQCLIHSFLRAALDKMAIISVDFWIMICLTNTGNATFFPEWDVMRQHFQIWALESI